jgi:acetyl esterase/lipase
MSPVATHDLSPTKLILEPAAQKLADATAGPPFLSELGYPAARKLLDDIQAGPVQKLPVDEEWVTVPAAVGDVRVRIIKPQASEGNPPVILYLHGGGWVLGNAGTHDRLVRELAVGSGAALAFVEYSRSPEARYPVAIEQAYATARWLVREGAERGLDGTRNQATTEQLRGLPATVALVDEADVLRDEGEAYAAKLRAAGVPVTAVRYDGISHDFMMLDPLSQTNATRAAIAQATALFRDAFDGE